MMRRVMRVVVVAGLVAALVPGGGASGAQQPGRAAGWNDSTTMALVARAVERRAQQLADTGLRDYTARATGYLTFLGQLGEGFSEPPRILKADQLALQVYWRAPDQSKQRIIGRRDTLLLPTDINYHRDHLGIIQNNFPEIIRLGDGDEVSDVPHPLSPAGLRVYDFRMRDSLRITLPGRVLDVSEVMVRPRDDRQARVIGSVFIERTDAQVVRMAFGFTRAAFLDRQLEDLSIVLENSLVGSRFWLPRRQEIEIRRAGTWLDYPARGIIRGRWEIGEYELNTGLPESRFAGPEIVAAPPAELRAYPWGGEVLDSLPPDIRATVDADVARVQEEARALVRAQALERVRGSAVSARAISDLVRSDRAEGLALGGGITRRFGEGFSATARARYGTDDRQVKGSLALEWQRASGAGVQLRGYSDFLDAGEVPERSGVVNSIASQELGSDYTDPVGVQGGSATFALGRRAGLRWSLTGAAERQHELAVRSAPAAGRHEGVLAFPRLDVVRGGLQAERPTSLGPWGTEVQVRAALRVSAFAAASGATVGIPTEIASSTNGGERSTVVRGSLVARIERPFGTRRLVSSTVAIAADGTNGIPPHELALFGGPVTGPGYDFHSLVATAGVSQRVEFQFPVPFPGVSLGRFGRAPGHLTLAPYAHAVALGGPEVRAWRRLGPGEPVIDPAEILPATPRGVHPSVGIGVHGLFDLLRIDVARGLRDGRWMFNVDVHREFWRIL